MRILFDCISCLLCEFLRRSPLGDGEDGQWFRGGSLDQVHTHGECVHRFIVIVMCSDTRSTLYSPRVKCLHIHDTDTFRHSYLSVCCGRVVVVLWSYFGRILVVLQRVWAASGCGTGRLGRLHRLMRVLLKMLIGVRITYCLYYYLSWQTKNEKMFENE